MIFVVCVDRRECRTDMCSGVTMLQMDRAKAKWRVKLGEAFAQKVNGEGLAEAANSNGRATKCAWP